MKSAIKEVDIWAGRRRKAEEWCKYLLLKIEALFWVGLATFTIWYSNFFYQIFVHPGINSLFLNLFLTTMGINVSLGVYVTIVLPLRGIEDYTEVYGERLHYIGAVSGFLSFVRYLNSLISLLVLSLLFGLFITGGPSLWSFVCLWGIWWVPVSFLGGD